MIDKAQVIKGLDIILNGCDQIQCQDCCFHIKEPAMPRRCGMREEQIQQQALQLLQQPQHLSDNPLVFFLALYAPAPENAPDDWYHNGELNLQAWKQFIQEAEQRGYYALPIQEEAPHE